MPVAVTTERYSWRVHLPEGLPSQLQPAVTHDSMHAPHTLHAYYMRIYYTQGCEFAENEVADDCSKSRAATR